MEPPQKGREGNIILIRIIWIEVKHGFKTIIFRATPASREISRRNEIFRKSVKEVTFVNRIRVDVNCQLPRLRSLATTKRRQLKLFGEKSGVGWSSTSTLTLTLTMTRSTRKGQKGRGRRPPGFGGHHGMVAMLHGHGIHLRWTGTHVVNADDDGEDLQADLHRRLRSAWESGRSQLQPGRSIQNHWRQVMWYKIAIIRWCCWCWCAPGATTWGIPTGALQTLGCDDTWRQSIKTHKIFPRVSQTICHVWCCSLFRGIHNCWSTDI